MPADAKRIAENHLKRLYPVVNDENIGICLQAASLFADGKLTELNVQKAAGAAGVTTEQMKTVVLLVLELHEMYKNQPSIKASLSRNDLLEAILEWSEAERTRLVIGDDGEKRGRMKGALISCEGRVDIEIARRTALVVPPQPSALLQLQVGGHQKEIRLRLEKSIIDRLACHLEEAIRSCNKK